MDQAKLGRVIGLWESGVSVSALAAEVNISDSTDLEKVASKDFRTTEETMVLLTKQPPEHQTILAEAMADHFQAVTIVGPTLGVTASPWIVRAQLKEAGLTRRGNALGMAQITLYGDTGTILLPLNKKGHLPLDLLQNFISKALNIP